jgi:hypothetical protein
MKITKTKIILVLIFCLITYLCFTFLFHDSDTWHRLVKASIIGGFSTIMIYSIYCASTATPEERNAVARFHRNYDID